MKLENSNRNRQQPIPEDQLQYIQKIAEDIRYGTITLVFQDGVLIQIEHNEKVRVQRNKHHGTRREDG